MTLSPENSAEKVEAMIPFLAFSGTAFVFVCISELKLRL
jgi:hypothetical protein